MYVCMCIYIYIYINIYAYIRGQCASNRVARQLGRQAADLVEELLVGLGVLAAEAAREVTFEPASTTGVCKQTLLLREPWPCGPAAETALQPLIRCFESLCSHVFASTEECIFHRHRYRFQP